MNRGDFQQLAEEHLRHAKALLDAGLYSGAYYMCGYAVECALKACISRKTNQSWWDLIKIISPASLIYQRAKQYSGSRFGPVKEHPTLDAYIYKMT